ncbi:Clp protease ClpP [Rhodobacteraceae bacterium R_SAG3]|nr:Clp protease ClpP [Rhodobacteraceae bacterium R_SAG3]
MSELFQGGVIRLFGTIVKDEYIWPADTGLFSARMVIDALEENQGDVTVLVNSDGGMPSEGEAIRAAFEAHPGNVTVKVTGNAHSAASLMIMSADHIEMSAGSLMLIHDPSTGAYGNPADLAAQAQELDVMAGAYAGVYAARAGITPDEARALMRAETMLTAYSAVEKGFADAVSTASDSDDTPPTMNHAAAIVAASAAMSRAREVQMRFEAAEAGLEDGASQQTGQEADDKKGISMSKQNTSAPADVPAPAPVAQPVMSAADAVAADRVRIKGIREAAAPFMAHVGQAEVDRMCDDGTSLDEANRVIMAAAAAGQPRVQRTRIVTDERETKRIGMTEAAVAQMLGRDPVDERAHAFMEMDFVEMAADLTGASRPRSVGAKADVLMSAGHSTSDFPLILSTAFNTVIESAYDLAEPTFGAFSREMTFNDFREHSIVRPDNFPTLKKVGEHGEIKFGTFGENKETIALASYGTGISVSRQLMVNDAMGAIAEVLLNAASIVPEFEEETFWAMLLSNPKLSDGKGVFHADHKNIGAAGAINTATVGEGRKAMRSHKLSDKRNLKQNAPAFLIVGPERETEAEQFLAPLLAAEQTNVNPLARKLRLVVSEEIEDSKWFLSVDPAKKTHSFKHGYLDGARAPRVRVDDPFGSQGTRMTIEHDFACGAVGYMGVYQRG